MTLSPAAHVDWSDANQARPASNPRGTTALCGSRARGSRRMQLEDLEARLRAVDRSYANFRRTVQPERGSALIVSASKFDPFRARSCAGGAAHLRDDQSPWTMGRGLNLPPEVYRRGRGSNDRSGDAAQKDAGPSNLGESSRRLIQEPSIRATLRWPTNSLLRPAAVDHDPATPAQMRGLRGPELLKRNAGMYRAAFPDVRISVDDVIAGGDKVVLRWHSEGTHRGELAGLAPTGAHGSVTGRASTSGRTARSSRRGPNGTTSVS